MILFRSLITKLKHWIIRVHAFLCRRYAPRGARISFAHSGEDILILECLQNLGITSPIYIDIGAHHPIFSNNTYLLYREGGQGIIVEPNSTMAKLARTKRPRDIVVEAGAGGSDGTETFFLFPQSTRSTFSKQQAEAWQHTSGQISTASTVPIYSLHTLIHLYCKDRTPDVISIDAEGLDIDILSGFDWHVRPKIFCVESVAAGVHGRNESIYSLLSNKGYSPMAETPANTIFVDTMTVSS